MVQKVYLVEDDEDFLGYIEKIVLNMNLVPMCFATGEALLEHIEGGDRGCIVSDIRLPGMSGISLLSEIRQRNIDLPFIILSGFATVKKTVKVMQDGAYTLLEKPFDEQDFWDSIHSALAAETKMHNAKEQETIYQELYVQLTSGEKDVLKRIIQGMPNKNIAVDLDVSLRTIEARRRKVFQKMNSKSVAELVTYTITANNRINFDPTEFSI